MQRITALMLAAAMLAACGPRPRPGIPPRHLVLVTFADLRPDHLGVYLHERPTSSLASDDTARREGRAMGIDDLAAAGVVFARCFAPSPHTMSSLASLFTSRSTFECGVLADDMGVPPDVPTLAELFEHAGFSTAAFVTTRRLDLEGALGRGFATFAVSGDDAGTLAAATAFAKRDQGDGSRRFVWIHLAGPAAAWDAEPAPGGPEVEGILAQRDFGPGLEPAERPAIAAGRASPDAAQRARAASDYDRAVARTAIGLSLALRDAFDYYESNADASETWARTVFALTSPNGTLLGEEGAVGHGGTLHEAVLHVPLFVRHPDSMTGERVFDDVVELADLLPTFVEWFDLPAPRRVQGRSLLALLDGRPQGMLEPRVAMATLPERMFSARDERFHLVWNPLDGRPADRPECAAPIPVLALYEPERDPQEREDVSARHPRVVAALQVAIRTWRESQIECPPQKHRRVGFLPAR